MKKRLSVVLTALLCLIVASSNAGEQKLVIGCNNPVKGIYSLDILEKAFVASCNALGAETLVVNDENRLENAVVNIEL